MPFDTQADGCANEKKNHQIATAEKKCNFEQWNLALHTIKWPEKFDDHNANHSIISIFMCKLMCVLKWLFTIQPKNINIAVHFAFSRGKRRVHLLFDFIIALKCYYD